MNGKKWVYIQQPVEQIKKKLIGKEVPTKVCKSEVTYKFKLRKIKHTDRVISLQNFKDKLCAIYETCKEMKLSRSVFLMSLKNFKQLFKKSQWSFITGPETMACVTLAVKFEEESKDPISKIVEKTKISKSEVQGAEYHVFQELQFKLPIFDTYDQDLDAIIKDWNDFILKYFTSKSEHLLLSSIAPATSQPFRNYCNLIIVTDLILAKIVDHIELEYRYFFSIGLFFVAFKSAQLIYIDFSFEDLLFKFCQQYITNFDHAKWKCCINELTNEQVLRKITNISLIQYSKMKEMEKITDILL